MFLLVRRAAPVERVNVHIHIPLIVSFKDFGADVSTHATEEKMGNIFVKLQ